MSRRLAIVFSMILVSGSSAIAEQACIKYHKCISLDAFKCDTITRSSAVHRVCYSQAHRYLVLWYKRRNGEPSEPYHFCELGPDVYHEFLTAPSMGRFQRDRITGTKNQHGPFDCRDHPIPTIPTI